MKPNKAEKTDVDFSITLLRNRMFATGSITCNLFSLKFLCLRRTRILLGWLNNLPVGITAHSQPSTSFNETPISLSKFLNLLCTCPQKSDRSI